MGERAVGERAVESAVMASSGRPRTLPVEWTEKAVRARRDVVHAMLASHWQPEGYTVPNGAEYPHQWLWDSCFHAITWAHLGDGDRAVAELCNVFAHQSDDGFVPHMTYWRSPDLHAAFWGRRHTSCITQPPMFGHALAVLASLGVGVPHELIDAAVAGLEFLVRRRPELLHPWESGCDDSPRWDDWCPSANGDASALDQPKAMRWDRDRWRATKGELVSALRFDPVTRSPMGSDRFSVRSAGFDALVAFNAAELASVVHNEGAALLADDAIAACRLQHRWDTSRSTWQDLDRVGTLAGEAAGNSGSCRTLDALLPLLLSSVSESPRTVGLDGRTTDAAWREVMDPTAFGGVFGPAAVHRTEASFDGSAYWRGPAWPHLTYLLWFAASRAGRATEAAWLGERLVAGAMTSGWAEYWHPDTGNGLGAMPQSWAGLAVVVEAGVVEAGVVEAGVVEAGSGGIERRRGTIDDAGTPVPSGVAVRFRRDGLGGGGMTGGGRAASPSA